MIPVLFVVYGTVVFVSLVNLRFIPRLKGSGPICFEVMVPARNEAENLPNLLPPLIYAGVKVTVFDDDSSDDTASIARELGATVISSPGPLPEGWTGKTRACHELTKHATAPWVLFLDADVHPDDSFAKTFASILSRMPADVAAVSGFPRMIPGKGLEPAYLGWVPWILLATNPFINGQIGAWPLKSLKEIQPYEAVKGEVLEDVKIGRLLAQKRKRVSILNLSDILAVHMYPDLAAAFKGMCKNSCEIAPGFWGSSLFALLFLVYGWIWIAGGPQAWTFLFLLMLSKGLTDRIIRYPLWTVLVMPLTCTAAAVTILYSAWLKAKGRIEWKGRTYAE